MRSSYDGRKKTLGGWRWRDRNKSKWLLLSLEGEAVLENQKTGERNVL